MKTVKPFFMVKNICSSDVAVAYDLAKVGERVRLPSIALLVKSDRLPSSTRSRQVFWSNRIVAIASDWKSDGGENPAQVRVLFTPYLCIISVNG